jgi:uncharacterized protein (TIGR02285 family)
MRNSIIFICFILICCYSVKSSAQEKLYWLSYDEIAFDQLTQGSKTHTSTVADTTRLLMNSLIQYQFSIEFAKSPSIARLLKKLPNACSPNRIKTQERLKENTFSFPLNISPNLRLYFLKGTKANSLSLDALDKENQLTSLSSLFTGKSVHTLGVDSGRSLGTFLDKQVSGLEKHNLVVRTGGGSTKSLVEMLLKGRIDYIIDYPYSVNAALNLFSKSGALESLKISGSPDYISGYVACHKGKKGQEIINNINTALQHLYKSPEFYQAHIRYLDKVNIEDFNRAYQEVFQVEIPIAYLTE